MASALPWPEAASFALGQYVAVRDLKARADLNDRVAEVIGTENEGRVAIVVGGERMRVRRDNLARTEAAPQEGKLVDGRIMLAGEYFSADAFLDKMFNSGEAVGDAFSALAKHEQADVLAGRRSLSVPDACCSTPPASCPPGACTVRE